MNVLMFKQFLPASNTRNTLDNSEEILHVDVQVFGLITMELYNQQVPGWNLQDRNISQVDWTHRMCLPAVFIKWIIFLFKGI